MPRTLTRLLLLVSALALAGCDDDPKGTPDPTDTASDTSVADVTGDTSTASDSADSTAPDTAVADVPEDLDAAVDGADMDSMPAYIEGCESLYAARIVELQQALDATFPGECDEALRADIGMFSATSATPHCNAGESANACQRRNYETPPPFDTFNAACTPTDPSCFVGKWLPKCEDGTDIGCAEPEAICVDGTRPAVHMEPATTGASNRWIIYMGGEGGPCTGDKCWIDYRFNPTDEFAKAMSSHHPDYALRATKGQGGIMAGEDVAANPFGAFNRVRMERCSDAASDADETVAIGDGVDPDLLDELPPDFASLPTRTRVSDARVYHRGRAVYHALFHSLTTDAGRDLDGDGTPDLPDLTNATQVVLAGSSDASVWLVFAADALADELQAIGGPDLDVRILVDGHFDVPLDTAGRLHPDAPAGFDAVRDTYWATGLCALPDNGDGVDNEACSDGLFAPGGRLRDSYDVRNVTRDASCEAFHGVGHPACSDKQHTLAHHVETPLLVLADQEDRTISGSPPSFADDLSYRFQLPDYRAGVLSFALDIEASWSTAAREEGPGTPGDLALILHKFNRGGANPGAATHVRFGDNDKMTDGITRCEPDGTVVASPTFAAMIGAWLDDTAPFAFAIEAGPAWDGTSDYWVTDPSCGAPE